MRESLISHTVVMTIVAIIIVVYIANIIAIVLIAIVLIAAAMHIVMNLVVTVIIIATIVSCVSTTTVVLYRMQAQREAQVQSPVLHSMLYQPGASSRRVSSASYGSPAGSSGSYRASSQLLPLDLHPSDPLSVHDLPQQNPPNPTLTHANPVSDTPSQASLTQSRLMRKSTEAPNSMDSVSVEQPGSPGTHVVQSGSKKQGGVGVTAGAGVQPSPDRAAMSVLQVRLCILPSTALCKCLLKYCHANCPCINRFCSKLT